MLIYPFNKSAVLWYNNFMHNTTKKILDYAIFKEAKEINIDTRDRNITVNFLIDGSWEEIINFSKDEFDIFQDVKKIVVKNVSNEDGFSGRFKINKGKTKHIFNVLNLSGVNNERIILSLEKEEVVPLSLKDLGLKEKALKVIEETIARPKGLILVTGLAGSGVTTTLYSLVNDFNNHEINISSIENLIEYDLPDINQTQIDIQNGYNIKNGIHHLVRQNSDIIMVNDINNLKDSRNIFEYSSCGMPIISSLNATDIDSVLTNFLQTGIDPAQMSHALDLIIFQKLVKDKENKTIREYSVLKIDDDVRDLFKKPRVTSSQLKRGISRIII